MKVLKLGTPVVDKATKMKGMLVNLVIDMDLACRYIFQPKGVKEEDGQPIDSIMLPASRVDKGIEEELDAPIHLLGTQGEDLASGFKGMIIDLIYHVNGCIHVNVKPAGVSNKGDTIDAKEFDIRRMKGDLLKPLKGKELKESIKRTPSPVSNRVMKLKS